MGLFSKKTEPDLIFSTTYFPFRIKVFKDRVEFNNSAGSKNIPIEQVSSVTLPIIGVWSITLETSGGEKYTIPTHKKKEVKEAIYKAKYMIRNQSDSVSKSEQLEKLFSLKEKGALTDEEFLSEKNKILNP